MVVVVMIQAQNQGIPVEDDFSTQLDGDLMPMTGESAPAEGQGLIREKRHKWKGRGYYYNPGYYGGYYNNYYRQPYYNNYYQGYFYITYINIDQK